MAKKENRVKKWRPGPPEVYSDVPIWYDDNGRMHKETTTKEKTKSTKRKK